jgi:peptide/nickel transport system substrate-binding protein
VRALLEPHADALVPGALDAYALPASDGSTRNRANMRRALQLLEEAGWTASGGRLVNASGQPFAFEILVQSGQATLSASHVEAIANLYADGLRQIGVEARIRIVDQAQFNERRSAYDYDMIVAGWAGSLSPGAEQRLYWGSPGVEAPGSRNYAGVDSPAVDAMIAALTASREEDDMISAARALDRALATGRYVVPLWHSEVSRIAHRAEFRFPERLPLYGDWSGWLPEVWWREP